MTTFLTGTISSFMLGAFLFIVAAYFVTYYLVYIRQIKRWKQANIPFLQPTFLLGHKYFLKLAKYDYAVPVDQIYKENTDKDLVGFFLGPMPVIMLKDRKLVREISVKYARQTFATGFSIPESEVELNYMITTTADEEKWKFSRTALMPYFSSSWFQGPRFGRIQEAIRELLHSAAELETDGSLLNVSKAAENAIISITASNFGVDSHSHPMMHKFHSIMNEIFKPSYHKTIAYLLNSFLPSSQKIDYFKFVPQETCNTMSAILNHQFNQRVNIKIENRDIIDIFRSLGAKEEPQSSHDKNSDMSVISKEVSQRKMTGLGLIALLSGSELLYTNLCFAIHALSLYPEYQRRIRREVHQALKKHGLLELNYEAARSLSFTFQCLFEASRLFPPGLLMRRCIEDFQIQGTSYTLRKGDRLIIPLYSLGRDKADFRDPHSFIPERFDFKDSNVAIPGTLLSFGIGQRKCPGYQQGLVLSGAILASLFYKYELKPCSHLKLMDATYSNPKGFMFTPRRDILVNLYHCEDLDDV